VISMLITAGARIGLMGNLSEDWYCIVFRHRHFHRSLRLVIALRRDLRGLEAISNVQLSTLKSGCQICEEYCPLEKPY